MRKRTILQQAVLAAVVATVVGVPNAQAAIKYFDTSASSGIQGGTGNWNNSTALWCTGSSLTTSPAGTSLTTFANGDQAVFATSTTSNVTVVGNSTVGSSGVVGIVQQAGGVGGTTIGGTGTLTLVTGSSDAIQNNNTNPLTISANLTLGNTIGVNMVMYANSGPIIISGAIGESATGEILQRKNGASNLTLSSTGSTYSGGTQVSANGGALMVGASSTGSITSGTSSATHGPLGTGNLVMAGGSIFSSDSSTARTIYNPVIFGGGTTTLGTATGTGNLFFGSGSINTNVALTLATNVTFSGNLGHNSGNRTFTLNGAGYSLTLAGGNDNVGANTINSGTLIVANTSGSATGTGVVTIAPGAKLAGAGRISGATTINGILAPGVSGGVSEGKLTFGSTLGLASSTLMDLDGPGRGVAGGYDAVDVTGALTYGGTMTLNFGSSLGADTTFNLFDFASKTGTSFTGISLTGAYAASLTPSGGTWTGTDGNAHFTFTESTGDLVVTIPEPASIGLLAFSSLLVLRRRSHNRA